tara:strand:+ start:1352 stop:1750 length:399 start_codon:yes stop_codon:yes gene_type:complete
MVYNLPSIYTTITIILFLLVFVAIAFIVKKKSKSIKKIIDNKKRINILEFLSVRGGYSAFVFSVNDEQFFFIGHKSGNGNLVQILKSENSEKRASSIEQNQKSDKILDTKKTSNKPLEQVNISDLLALHKKS